MLKQLAANERKWKGKIMQGGKILMFIAAFVGSLCMPSMSSARTDSSSTQPRLEARTIKDGLGLSVTYHIAQPFQPGNLRAAQRNAAVPYSMTILPLSDGSWRRNRQSKTHVATQTRKRIVC